VKTSQYIKTHISFVTGKLIVYLDSSSCVFVLLCLPHLWKEHWTHVII